ncbi:unnamed protein product [Arctia plantaginis]|uniref:Uncharacterized protein n=1 Tax=Arctia plantaginis TaxID=874455 RepID=A0A8S1A286_ARCPL|nr:unnamed protein product [Arctia plantaginis]
MSQFLWSLGKLVNDPTTALFQEVRFRVFGSNVDLSATEDEPICSKNTANPKPHYKIPPTSKVILKSSKACDTRDISELIEVKSKSVQVNFERRKHRQVSIQCQNLHHKTCKSTSTSLHIHSLDRSTGESQIVEKKDTETHPQEMKLCQSHYETLLQLQDWEALKQKLNSKKSSKFCQLKAALANLASLLKIEKIESLSPHIHPNEQIMTLYKRETWHLVKK